MGARGIARAPARVTGVALGELEPEASDAAPGHVPAQTGPGPGRRLGYLPELDGLRAVSVLAVLAFHHGFAVARGGFLAVSSFFTLSGFLIASLALDEWAETGTLSFARFWERRARRLLPAALVTLAGIAVLQATLSVGSGSGFRFDLLSTLGYGTNWRLVAQGGDYAGLFTSPSPLTHFWSVAIEEQFYLAFPLAFVGLMALGRRRSRTVAGGVFAGRAFAAAAVASFAVAAATAARDGNGSLAYYGTHTRAAEILTGVALAYALAAPGVRDRLAASRPAAAIRAIRAAGCVGLAVLALLWHSTSLGDPHLFRGVTALNALATCAVIAAAVTRGGPTRRLLASPPLTAIGKISYAAYLFHWPLFLVLDGSRVHVGFRTLFAVRVVATLAAAAVSYWLLEQPFRRRRVARTRPRLGLSVAAGALAVTVLTVGLPVHPSDDVQLAADGRADDTMHLRERDVVPVRPGRVAATVLAAGDSVSWSLLFGMSGWNDRHTDQQLRVDAHLAFGCPLSGPGHWQGPHGLTDTFDACETWLPDLPAAIERSSPSVVMMVMGLADLGGREVDGEWRHPGDPVFDRWFARRVDRVADALTSGDAPVVWLTYPYVRVRDRYDPTRSPDSIPLNDPARADAVNAVLRRVVGHRPGITLLDLNSFVAGWPDQFDPELRDGVHFRMPGSMLVANWLVPRLLMIAAASGTGEPVSQPPAPSPG